jgi:hypothetical protein
MKAVCFVPRNDCRCNKYLASYALVTPETYTETYRGPHASARFCCQIFNER